MPIAPVHALIFGAVAIQSVAIDTLYSVGNVTGPEETTFGRVVDMAFAPDGRLFVLDASDAYVRVFDPTGTPLQMFGGAGRGPGELHQPTALEWVDSVVAITHGSSLSIFSATGRFIDSERIPGTSVTRAIPLGPTVVLLFREGIATTSGIDPLQSLTLVEGSSRARIASGPSGGVFVRTSNGSLAIDAGLCGAVSVTYLGRGRFAVGDGARGTVSLFDGNDPNTTWQVAPEAGAIPEERLSEVRALVRSSQLGREPSAEITLPPNMSTICAIEGETPDRTWLERSFAPERWQRIDLELGDLGPSVTLRNGERLLAAAATRLATVSSDELGVQRIVVYGVREHERFH